LIVPGLLIRALASGHVRKNEALATSGPYAYTRNPLYLGSLLMGVGFAIAARSWWVGVILVVMFLAIYLPVIRDEENYLRQKFPEFEEYARRVLFGAISEASRI
jgi:protein-S-isoprenylcysteine O-methyltransferase Ste14